MNSERGFTACGSVAKHSVPPLDAAGRPAVHHSSSMMRKFLCLCLVLCLSSGAWADDYVGFLSRLKTTPEEFFMLMKNSWANKGWVILGGDHSSSKARFYDSLALMQMALNRGEIDEMILPDFAAEYLLRVSDNYEPSCVSSSGRMSLCFGFMKDNTALLHKWNSALTYLRNNWTLAGLEKKYIKDFPADDNYSYVYGTTKKQKDRITFTKFPDAPTVRVAVTGDLPPADFVDEEGLPAGYSLAVLSEIGRILKVNIIPVNVSAGARTAALVSGRADVVFWYEVNRQTEFQPDIPDDVILSEPYLDWDKFIHVRLSEEE